MVTKKRKITKVSLKTDADANGIAIKITLNFENMNDAKIFVKDYLVNDELLKKNKKYYVADSCYYTDQILV